MRKMKYKLGGLGDELFSSQTLSFFVTILLEKMKKCCTIGGQANPYYQLSRVWLTQAPFVVHLDLSSIQALLFLVKMKYFYRQLQAKNFYSFKPIRADFSPIKSHHSNYHYCLLVNLPHVMTCHLQASSHRGLCARCAL